jgi:hypothetical protein
MPQTDRSTTMPSLPEPVVSYVRAVNAGAIDDFRNAFSSDAVVVDVNRELSGLDAITDWAGADIFGANVRYDILNVAERQGRTVVLLKIDGTFDRTGLPDPLVMNHEFRLAEGKIVELRIGFESTR